MLDKAIDRSLATLRVDTPSQANCKAAMAALLKTFDNLEGKVCPFDVTHQSHRKTITDRSTGRVGNLSIGSLVSFVTLFGIALCNSIMLIPH